MRKTITLILLSLFIVGSAFSQVKRLPESKKYRDVEHTKKNKTLVTEKKNIQSKEGQVEVQGFEDVTDSWPAGWTTASSSDLTGADWTTTDFTQGDNTWFVNTPESFQGEGGDYIYNGNRSAAIGYTAGQEGNSYHWLVSKEVELPSDTAFLSFMTWFQASESDGWYTYFHVNIHVDGAWENLVSWDADSEEHVNLWESVVDIDLKQYAGKTVKFGFAYEYNDGYQMALDSIAFMNVPAADDAGVSKILSPESGVHPAGDKEVSVVVQNYGADPLTSADVTWGMTVDGEYTEQSTQSWTGELPQGEKDTISFGNYSFSERGNYKITAFTSSPNGESDVNTDNDTSSTNITIYEDGQLYEEFEEGSFVNGWEATGSWTVGTNNPYEGDYSAEIAQSSSSSEAKLMTPKVVIDGPETLKFYAGGMNNTAGYGSSKLQIMYSADKETWEPLGEQIDFAQAGDAYKQYNIDLDVPSGEYYLAFSTTSDFSYMWFASAVFIDNVIGPILTAPEAVSYTPEENATGVNLDATVSVEFDQKVDSVDFTGIGISGESEGEVANVSATLSADQTTLMISHDPFANNNEEYTVTIPDSIVTNGSAYNGEISWSFTSIMAAPQLVSQTPASGASGVTLDDEVSVVFDQMINEVDFSGIALNGTQEGTVSGVNTTIGEDGKSLIIAHDDFAGNDDTISVTIPQGVVENVDGVGNPNTIEWDFATLKAGQPAAQTLTPANNAVGVALDADIMIEFNTAIDSVDFSNITIEGVNEGTVSNITTQLVDSTIHISHEAFANNDELYTVTIPAGAVESQSTSEQNAEIKWNFTTIMTAPTITDYVPADAADMVAVDAIPTITFDQIVDDSSVDLDTMITIIGANEDTVQNINAYLSMDEKSIMVDHDAMMNNVDYTATLKANAIQNRDGLGNDAMSWQFNTIMAMPAAMDATPDTNAIGVPLDATVSVTMDQELEVNDLGAVEITSEANGKVANVSATLADNNKTINIAHDRFFDANDDTYTVAIPSRSVKNSDGIYNGRVQWSFMTEETHDVTFVVKSGSDSIEAVNVEFSGMNIQTDDKGIAFFNGASKGENVPYTVYKENYDTLKGSVDVMQPMTIVVTLEESYTVTFNVTDGAGAVSGAEVTFNSETLTTDSEGNAEFTKVGPGSNLVYLVSKADYESVYGTMAVSSNSVKNVTLQQSGTGINKLEEYGINVYPLPASNNLNIDNMPVTGTQKVEIIDVTGKVILSKNISDVNNDINVSGLDEGIYFLRLHMETEVINSRIAIE